jgi:hypothetical protein
MHKAIEQVARWQQAAAEIRATPESRASFLALAHWVADGDGPRPWDQDLMERLLDKVLDGPPLILDGDD